MSLNELRAARKMTQEKLAENLHVKQSVVSELERRADMYVSTLREFIAAMGGELEITARFPTAQCASTSSRRTRATRPSQQKSSVSRSYV
jgi:transcriptional regulator with XRE-family HTH domain